MSLDIITMAGWQLYGKLNTIDQFGKLHFSYEDSPQGIKTKERLFKYLHGGLLPYNDDGFWIVPKEITSDMKNAVGYNLKIEVKPINYSFRTKYDTAAASADTQLKGIKFKLLSFIKN